MADKQIALFKNRQNRTEKIMVTGLDDDYDVIASEDEANLPEGYLWIARFDFKEKPGKKPKSKSYKIKVNNRAAQASYYVYTGKGDPTLIPDDGYPLEVGDPAIGIANS